MPILEVVLAQCVPGFNQGNLGLGDPYRDFRGMVVNPVLTVWCRAVKQANVE